MASPRISFSDDLSTTSASGAHLPPADPNCVSVDFDFGVIADASESYLADDLFFDGVLLPTLPVPTPKVDGPMPLEASTQSFKKPSNTDARKRSPTRKSLWPFRRSSSLNVIVDDGRKAALSSSKLVRSKSAEPRYKQHHAREGSSHGKTFSLKRKNGASPERVSNESKTRRYYYSGGSRRSYGDGVRVGLILNVSLPSTSSILKTFSNLLMWSCGGKRTRKDAAATSRQ